MGGLQWSLDCCHQSKARFRKEPANNGGPRFHHRAARRDRDEPTEHSVAHVQCVPVADYQPSPNKGYDPGDGTGKRDGDDGTANSGPVSLAQFFIIVGNRRRLVLIGEEAEDLIRREDEEELGEIRQRLRRVSRFSTDRRNCRGVEEPLRRSRRRQNQRKNHSEDRWEEEIQVSVVGGGVGDAFESEELGADEWVGIGDVVADGKGKAKEVVGDVADDDVDDVGEHYYVHGVLGSD
ncbi:hypothetical protein U1Q18_033471 [Sarracenia purpurea var. burkii]